MVFSSAFIFVSLVGAESRRFEQMHAKSLVEFAVKWDEFISQIIYAALGEHVSFSLMNGERRV